MSLYRKILKQALIVSWQKKHLWFFGLFAALFIDHSGFEFFFQILNKESEGLSSFFASDLFSFNGLANAGTLLSEQPLMFAFAVLVLLFILALFLFLLWLAIVSQLAIVNNSAKFLANKEVKLADGLLAGFKNFWPALVLNALAFAIMLIPVLLTNLIPETLFFKTFYFLVFIMLAVLVIAFSLLIKFAIANLVIKNGNISDSFEKGWELFNKNWLICIETAVILMLIAFATFVIIKLALLPLVLILISYFGALLFGILPFSPTTSAFLYLFFLILGHIVSLIIIILFGAYIATFQIVVWTKLYIELSGKGAESKLVRIVKSFQERQ